MKQFTQAFHDILYIWWREMKLVVRDEGVLIFFVLLPLGYPLLYAFIYSNEAVREVPAVALDESQSVLGREFLRKVDGSPEVHFVAYAADLDEARRIMRERGAYGIIRIPASFSQDLHTGKQTLVGVYCDMSGLLYYKALVIAATDVSLKMNNHIKIAHSGDTTEEQDRITAYPIAYQSVGIFNPTEGFASFLIPAVLILILQQILLLGVGLSAGTARETNRFRDLIPVNRHYHGLFRIVFGKALCYFLIFMLVSTYVLCAVPMFFSFPQIGHPLTLLAFIVPYLLACIFFAMTCSVFIRNRENCMPIFVFTSLPLLFISGISWPGTAVPEFWKWVSYLFPSTFGINGYVRINNMGALLSDVVPEYQALWLQTGVYFVTTCLVYRYQIILTRKHLIEKYREMKTKRVKIKKNC